MNFTDMAKNLSEALGKGVPIMVAGMVGIFIVTLIIILSVYLLSKIGGGDGNFSRGLKALFGKKD